MKRKKQLKLTEGDKEFVKDFSRKIILRAYLANSANSPRTLTDRLKRMFAMKSQGASSRHTGCCGEAKGMIL